MINLSKEVLDQALSRYPNHVEFISLSKKNLKVTVYRLQDVQRIIGILGINTTTNDVASCKVSEAFLEKPQHKKTDGNVVKITMHNIPLPPIHSHANMATKAIPLYIYRPNRQTGHDFEEFRTDQ